MLYDVAHAVNGSNHFNIFSSFSPCSPGAVFTTLHFLRNLRMGPRVFHQTGLEKLVGDKHSSLLNQFLSYEANCEL